MALLSVLSSIQDKISLESYAILRDSSSKKSKYPKFIYEIALNSPELSTFFIEETGFINTLKELLQYPTEESLQIYDKLLNIIKLFPERVQKDIYPSKEIIFPDLTDDRLQEIVEVIKSVSFIKEKKEDKKEPEEKKEEGKTIKFLIRNKPIALLSIPRETLLSTFFSTSKRDQEYITDYLMNSISPELQDLGDYLAMNTIMTFSSKNISQELQLELTNQFLDPIYIKEFYSHK